MACINVFIYIKKIQKLVSKTALKHVKPMSKCLSWATAVSVRKQNAGGVRFTKQHQTIQRNVTKVSIGLLSVALYKISVFTTLTIYWRI